MSETRSHRCVARFGKWPAHAHALLEGGGDEGTGRAPGGKGEEAWWSGWSARARVVTFQVVGGTGNRLILAVNVLAVGC